MVTVEGEAGVSAAVEDQIVGIYADLGGDENGVAGEVDEGDEAWRGVGSGAGGGDCDGKLLRLRCGANGIDGADDGAVGVAAADDGCRSGGCQSEPEWGPEGLCWRPEGLRQGPNGAPVWPRLGVCFCFDSC